MVESKAIWTNDDGLPLPLQKLMVSGLICLQQQPDPVEIWRQMPVLTQDGEKAGVIAAVVLNDYTQKTTHILLGSAPPTAEYHLIPINLIWQVREQAVWLRIKANDIKETSLHQPDC